MKTVKILSDCRSNGRV